MRIDIYARIIVNYGGCDGFDSQASTHFHILVKIAHAGPIGRVDISVDISLPCLTNHLTAVSGVGSNPTWGTCETSQVLLGGVPGLFSRAFSRFRPPTDWLVSYELK